MNSMFDEGQPIFQQIADMIEDDILNGTYQTDDQIISMSQFASTFQVNPATAVKGIALLVNEGILYKKRGLGMFVAADAKSIILTKRQDRFYNELVLKLLDEAEKLELTTEDVIEMIKQRNRR
ncbi:transcriptional regulator, GntR family protein [Paenibacillus vortex V453]|jgi:GntR family transcriptional regulator|uniref:GntR family transcriptional regulator n=2 Tax=Paenibacillus TaxID=44249 RepID=A0A163J588_9BACL|nr:MULTISPECIES: GntR family transcriptional regulator [Paenibacillus]ANA80355.1 GntR family transcriptional regulator [Paenibacillus glucanolyticus]AVV55576.1 GntR family transcriptional regulator [Paenibacillus glucanolyticus]AWP30156.1 GntR family transcriptional regulator [Paenibacillus sp. Cedars]EFU43319.1 transcriptional regulator, GntR family protein [Paenibacillus vortex V453]ETT30560.1 GntR family transcriptional regulator [Paenibacillus sp. FSL R5-808]